MKFKSVARILFFLLPLTFVNGCATKALWDNGDLEAWREPANPVNLHLFNAKQRKDLLVVYSEYSERSGVTRTRAYWLNQNQERVERRHEPDFVSTNLICNLPPVPVFYFVPGKTTNQIFYAVVATNQQSFVLYSTNSEIGSYDLPFYNDGKGKFEKIAFTPLTVTADITIIGGVIGYWWLEASGGEVWPVSH